MRRRTFGVAVMSWKGAGGNRHGADLRRWRTRNDLDYFSLVEAGLAAVGAGNKLRETAETARTASALAGLLILQRGEGICEVSHQHTGRQRRRGRTRLSIRPKVDRWGDTPGESMRKPVSGAYEASLIHATCQSAWMVVWGKSLLGAGLARPAAVLLYKGKEI